MKNVTIALVSTFILTGLVGGVMAQTAPSDAMSAAVFSRLDADLDGSVSLAEMTAHKSAQFARADRDGDGTVDAAEMDAVRDRMAKLMATARSATEFGIMRMDTDGDGGLSLAEYTARAPIFVLMDGNGDGAVTRAEFDRARAAFAN